MNTTPPGHDVEGFRDHITTVDQKGKRLWIYPKKPKGRFYNARTYTSWILLALLFIIPFIKINGEPILLFNVLERKFIIFGILFTTQDFHILGISMIALVVFIILFTVVFGRLFCGWVCPQTIFMEMVFRKIEYLIEGDANKQRKLNAASWTTEKIIKKISKQTIFFLISVLIANIFLAYVISSDEVLRIITEPVSQNLNGFIAMLLFSFIFFGVFAYMREQVCIAICPYGRLQGVLLSKDSVAVSYDFIRGEPRRKTKKKQKRESETSDLSPILSNENGVTDSAIMDAEVSQGDCIDCGACVRVCPTGIDIRNGTQLECVNCTACIDACDEIMDKVEKPRGLIRYDSYTGINERRKKIFRPRVIGYSVVLVLLIVFDIALITGRSDVEALVLRTPGKLYQKVDENTISNLYNYQIINKTSQEMPIEFKLQSEFGKIRVIGTPPTTKDGEVSEGALFIDMPLDKLENRKTKLTVEVYSEGKLIEKAKTTFLGPMKLN
ncbi:MAG: cytochrome c oxidase accessory protein CcoG [Bacteroidetes bacterium]|nr:cytochrome c oxidase accessory protein CcoG [Bacteroidota bacterium]